MALLLTHINSAEAQDKIGWPITADEDAIWLADGFDYNCHCYAWYLSEGYYINDWISGSEMWDNIQDFVDDELYIPSYYLEDETDKIFIIDRRKQYDFLHNNWVWKNSFPHSMIRSQDERINRFPEWVESTNGSFDLFRHKLDRWYYENEERYGFYPIEPFTEEEVEGYWSMHYIKPRIHGEDKIFKYTARKQEAVYITNASYSWISSNNIIIVSTDYNKVTVRGTIYGRGWIEFTVHSHTWHNSEVTYRKYLEIVPEPALYSLSVSPNPVPSNMVVLIETTDGNNEELENIDFGLEILNIHNTPVLQHQFTGNETNINSSTLQNGVYVVKVQNQEQQIFLSKVILIHK